MPDAKIYDKNRWSYTAKEGKQTMARKTVSRMAKREEAEAAEQQAKTEDTKKAKAAPKRKKATKRKTAKSKEVRLKLFWGVFTQSLRRVAIFNYEEKAAAEKKAEELSESQGSPHFVQKVKEVIEE